MKASGLEPVTHECGLSVAAGKLVKVGNFGVLGATAPVRDALRHEVGNRLLPAIVFHSNIDCCTRLFEIDALGQQELRIEIAGRILVLDPAVGNHDRSTEEGTQLAVALVHDFFNGCRGRRRHQARKQPSGANKSQGTAHPSSSDDGTPGWHRPKSGYPRSSFTPAIKPFVADKAKSVQAAIVASEESLPLDTPSSPRSLKPGSKPERTSSALRLSRPAAIRVQLGRPRRNSMIAALPSAGRSCWVQWPQPGSILISCSAWTNWRRLARYSAVPAAASTMSWSPAM